MVLFEHLLIEAICFYCIIIEHILKCLIWWHSVSYVGHYITLGHTPIFEFIKSFAYFLITRSIYWSLWVVILRHMPSLGSSYLLLIIWSFDPFVDTSESFTRAYLIFIEFTISVTSLGFFWGVYGCRPHSLFLIFALSVFDYRLHTSLFSWSLFSASLFGKFI